MSATFLNTTKGKWLDEVKFVHVQDQKCTPISVSAVIYEGNPASTPAKRTIYTKIEGKKMANKIYNTAAKNGLTAMKMEYMSEKLSKNFLKFTVSIVLRQL